MTVYIATPVPKLKYAVNLAAEIKYANSVLLLPVQNNAMYTKRISASF